MDFLALEQIEPRLAAYRPDEVSQRVAPRRAAVAAVLRYDGASPQVLLMKRVERQTDRWSGHVSFPGGRAEPEDATLVHTAIRETREELGVDLSQTARRIGQLDDTMAVARGKVIPMAIRPYVFVQTEAAEVILESRAFPPRRAAAMQHALTRSRVDHAGRRKKVFLNHGGDLRYALRIRRLPLRRFHFAVARRRRCV